ncbi:MAG: NUDIX hydrolase [Chloroflexota bacterium]
MTPFYCSHCGNPTVRKMVEEEERERQVCESCGVIHYVNPKVVAGTLPVDGDRVWLLRRAIEPRYGFWTHPAGFLEMNETVEEGAARETMEELSMRVDVRDLLGVYSRAPMSTVHIVYLADALELPRGGRETLEFAAFHPDTIPWDDLAFWSTQRALHDWIARSH